MFTLTQQDAQASNAVVIGIISICSHEVKVLYDHGSTHSYVLPYFAKLLGRNRDKLRHAFLVASSVWESLLVEHVFRL